MTESLLQRILDQITPADPDTRIRAREILSETNGLAELASRIAAAQHVIRPIFDHKHVVICAADHGALATTDSGSSSTALDALEEVDRGRAAINSVARTAGASISIIDCGVYRPEHKARPPRVPRGVIDLRVGNRTADIRCGPAMSHDQAIASLHTGIALLLSLSDAGADCIALGQIAPGARVVNETLIAVLIGIPPSMLEPSTRDLAAPAIKANRVDERDPLAVLAAFGGFEIGVMTGLLLGAASLHIPTVLDESGTSAAALLATRLAPSVRDYTVASHAGGGLCHKQALHDLGLTALFDIGISHGEGLGAALAMPMLESAARLLCERATASE